MKRAILIDGVGDDKWIGGLYYRRNIAFELTQNPQISKKYRIIVVCSKKNLGIFNPIRGIKVLGINSNSMFIQNLIKGFYVLKYRVKYIFPLYKNKKIAGVTAINWIPDFQHKHFPEYFTNTECKKRDDDFSKYSKIKMPLVLSSKDSLKDFVEYFSPVKCKVGIVRFVSYIENDINSLNESLEKSVLGKYDICKKYAVIMNQFWQHKNHIIVFKAIKEYFAKYPNSEFQFVFTGKMEDYRHPEYIEEIVKIAKDPTIANHIKILGFIDRVEQIAIMKNAEYVIQPSLFEGWGTVVEDAKVLDKTILLSNIAVHREQKSDKSVLFDPYNSNELFKLIEIENEKEHIYDVQNGIKDMYRRARRYSEGFLKLLFMLEK